MISSASPRDARCASPVSTILVRFSEVVEFRAICLLQIHGKINIEMLSPKTIYGAYLMVKFAGRAYGLDTLQSQISEEEGSNYHQEREDECIEIELRSFYNDGGDAKEVEMCQKEVPGEHLKGALIVEGIELRPKKMVKV
ncbi:hypothetical protein Peur_064793 [Populus x canadensis]